MRGKNPSGHIYIVYSSTIEHLPSTHETVGFIPSTVSIYFCWGGVPHTVQLLGSYGKRIPRGSSLVWVMQQDPDFRGKQPSGLCKGGSIFLSDWVQVWNVLAWFLLGSQDLRKVYPPLIPGCRHGSWCRRSDGHSSRVSVLRVSGQHSTTRRLCMPPCYWR